MIEIQVVPEQPKALEVEAEGWWNDDHDVYTWPVRVGKWGAKIECHGSTPMEAQALALHVVTAIGAIGNATPAPETEPPTTVGSLILGGAVSSTELGDNDVTLDSQVVERLQRELVKDSEDIAVELMLVGQHYRIVGELRGELADIIERYDNLRTCQDGLVARVCGERDAAQSKVAELEKQEPVAFVVDVQGYKRLICATREEAASNAEHFEKRGRKSPITPLYANPVAQAGRVPDSAASAKALVEIEAKKYSLNAAGMFNSGAPGHGQTIAVQELLAGFDDDEAEGHWEAIMAYSDLRASNALFHAAELLAAAPAQGGE